MNRKIWQRYLQCFCIVAITLVLTFGLPPSAESKAQMSKYKNDTEVKAIKNQPDITPLLNDGTFTNYSSEMQGYKAGDEITSMRTRTSKTVWLGGKTFQTTFYGSPEYTQATDKSFVPYIFTEGENYYQIQHPFISARFYDSYTVIYDENFSNVLAQNDSWMVQYKDSQGEWAEALLDNPSRSYE